MAKDKKKGKVSKKKKKIGTILEGVFHIQSTFNNTIVTLSDLEGNTLAWSSAGGVGFKGSKKSTPYAAGKAAEKVAQYAVDTLNMRKANIFVNGPGAGRDTAIRSIVAKGVSIGFIEDITPVPHNGCKPRKRRRV
ncbi:30S ribosomal protein S11 [bacterium]|nr:30S ribosomal protein S11 [bacterium]